MKTAGIVRTNLEGSNADKKEFNILNKSLFKKNKINVQTHVILLKYRIK